VLVGEWFLLTLWNIKDNCQAQYNIPEDLTLHFLYLTHDRQGILFPLFDRSKDIQIFGFCGVFVSHKDRSLSVTKTVTEYVQPSSDAAVIFAQF
jgi:hypothetical protein